jgi:hypothetical protein
MMIVSVRDRHVRLAMLINAIAITQLGYIKALREMRIGAGLVDDVARLVDNVTCNHYYA